MCNEEIITDTSTIIQSIALEKAALSQIITAESNGIKKYTSENADANAIAKMFIESNRTLAQVMRLEQIFSQEIVAIVGVRGMEDCLSGGSGASCCDENNKCRCDIDGGIFTP